VGRPTKPIISTERAARAALGVIDVRGLDAFSLELVANRIGIKAPSLYYHFKSKTALLAEVARLILLDVKLPEEMEGDWRDRMIALSVATRRSILQHPNAAPLLLQFFPRHLLLGSYDHWISEYPLPPEQHMIFVEGLEKLTFGSALFEAACRARAVEPMPQFDHARYPNLAEAVRTNVLDDEALFVETLRRYIDGFTPFMTDAKAPEKKKPARKTTPRKPRSATPATASASADAAPVAAPESHASEDA
jgi:TetR/AcrR family transcriptional regulator, tetracycline repressor protein